MNYKASGDFMKITALNRLILVISCSKNDLITTKFSQEYKPALLLVAFYVYVCSHEGKKNHLLSKQLSPNTKKKN